MLCRACLLVLSIAATNQLAYNVALVAGTRLVNLKASAATFLFQKNYGSAVNYIISHQSISLDIYGYIPYNYKYKRQF